jgi:hypothetical protein
MFNNLMKNQLQKALKITFEFEPEDLKSEDDEIKKEGLAPALPKMDEKKGMKVKKPDSMELDEITISKLIPERDAEEYMKMDERGEKPKGLRAKGEMEMVKSLAKGKKGEKV